MNQLDLEQFIKKQGWSMFGISDFDNVKRNLKKHEGIFDKWVEKGFVADMDYLKRMKGDRFDPAAKLPDIKSVIVLGAIYSNGGVNSGFKPPNPLIRGNSIPQSAPQFAQQSVATPNNWGTIARYARGKDYHKILKKKLIELSNWLKINVKCTNVKIESEIRDPRSEIDTYVSVDSGPTVDRVLAESAGIGFFGKNSCIIYPSRGSYFFIASVLTNFDLQPTVKKSMPNCGNCQKCQQSCPTGALVSPGVIDARKCISYLTIENKSEIPEELRSKIGNRIFGCDACQEVCPFNIARAHKQEVTIEKLKGDYGVGECLDLREILSIKTDEEFTEKFADTPLMRAKRRGLFRNACVVAGNSGDKTLIPILKQLSETEKDVMIANHAKWAIEKLSNI